MNDANTADGEGYREYVRLLLGLHGLFVEGKGESPEADALRDRMDAAWEKLDHEQVEGVAGLASDLNWVRRGPAPLGTLKAGPVEDDLLALNHSIRSGEWHQVLKDLRRMGSLLRDSALSYLRGDAWRHLGDYAVASLFFEHARAIEPKNSEFASASTDCLAHLAPNHGGAPAYAPCPRG